MCCCGSRGLWLSPSAHSPVFTASLTYLRLSWHQWRSFGMYNYWRHSSLQNIWILSLFHFRIFDMCYCEIEEISSWVCNSHLLPCRDHWRSVFIPSRRFVWNFFRLENEHLNNCGEFRAVRDISVAPLNADDQTLLEQMMDQEDGVRNRQGKKSWKRSYSMSLRRPRLASQYVFTTTYHDCMSLTVNLMKPVVHTAGTQVERNQFYCQVKIVTMRGCLGTLLLTIDIKTGRT